ncbi:hypothetical protein Bbelb_246000 [Branchiostoma belcheri]|nr:hypothetical protein Bbelb_246000 [Branchiostoma belcheri]
MIQVGGIPDIFPRNRDVSDRRAFCAGYCYRPVRPGHPDTHNTRLKGEPGMAAVFIVTGFSRDLEKDGHSWTATLREPKTTSVPTKDTFQKHGISALNFGPKFAGVSGGEVQGVKLTGTGTLSLFPGPPGCTLYGIKGHRAGPLTPRGPVLTR